MGQPRIRTRLWRNGTLEQSDFPFEQVPEHLARSGALVWVDLVDPDEPILRRLTEELELDEHAVEDAMTSNERPKTARYPTHLFLTANALHYDGASAEVRTSRVSAFATRGAFVTVRLGEHVDMDAVVRRWDDDEDLVAFGTRGLVHGLLDELADGYLATVEAIDDAVESIEDILFDEGAKSAREVSRRTYALRRAVVRTRRAVLPMRDVVDAVMHRAVADDGKDELEPYFADIRDHVLRAAEWTDSLREMISSVFETNLQLADNRMNTIMKKLTSWAAIIAVPTAVTGYFGQNVPYPGFDQDWGFWVSVVAMVLIAAALYVSFKRRDWL